MLKGLNTEQRKAVTHTDGPFLIVAGAGTGKTTVITKKLAHLILKKKIPANNILALTFTEKATDEMLERVERLVPESYYDLQISTFHSFCEKVLREYALDAGISLYFKLAEEKTAKMLIRRHWHRFTFNYYHWAGDPSSLISSLVKHFGRCKDQAITPEEYVCKDEQTKDIARAYQTYNEILIEENYLDFGDLINKTRELLLSRPNILKKFQEKYQYILVDEFQDTNWVQYELVKLIACHKNLTVCADDDQAIYRWRGASFSNIVLFGQDFPEADEVFLTKNYRSCQNILDLAHRSISFNNPNRLEVIRGIDKKLRSQIKGKGTIEHIHFATIEQEAQGVVNRIVEKVKDKKASCGDFAILVRANNHANIFAHTCQEAGLPYHFMAMSGLYSQPIVLDIVSLLKVVDNHNDDKALYRLLCAMGFSEQKRAELVAKKERYGHYLYDVLDAKTKKLIEKFSSTQPASVVAIKWMEESGYLKNISRESLEYLPLFQEKIELFERRTPEPSLHNFLEELKWEIDSGDEGRISFDIDPDSDVVKIMTIHGAKGLEFKHVFLVNLVEQRFPVRNRKEAIEIPDEMMRDVVPEGDAHLQEERRLFYVAITRAKQSLYLTSAKDCGGKRAKKISQFLTELNFSDKDVVGKERIDKTSIKKKPQLVLPKKLSYTQIKKFNTCPYAYKLSYLIKLRLSQSKSLSYGSSLHNALEKIVRDYPMTWKQAQKIFKEEWIGEWYDSPEDKEKHFQKAEETLKTIFDEMKKNPPQVLKINNQLALELPFEVKIGEAIVKGKIDRVDEGIEIIDYKTGKEKDPDKDQLAIYQIALEDIWGLYPDKLTYWYLDQNKKVSCEVKEKQKEKIKEKIKKTYQDMRNSDFPATPGFHCSWCEYKDICDKN